MFTMMNHARLNVGIQGVGISERAYQQALAYARERVQGRPIGEPGEEARPIVHHPDVRRMLMDMKARIEAMRARAYYTSGIRISPTAIRTRRCAPAARPSSIC